MFFSFFVRWCFFFLPCRHFLGRFLFIQLSFRRATPFPFASRRIVLATSLPNPAVTARHRSITQQISYQCTSYDLIHRPRHDHDLSPMPVMPITLRHPPSSMHSSITYQHYLIIPTRNARISLPTWTIALTYLHLSKCRAFLSPPRHVPLDLFHCSCFPFFVLSYPSLVLCFYVQLYNASYTVSYSTLSSISLLYLLVPSVSSSCLFVIHATIPFFTRYSL